MLRPEKKKRSASAIIALVVLGILAALTIWSFADSTLNVPVISPITCSIKGGTWTDGSVPLGIPAGCYNVSSTPSGESP